MYRMMQGYSGYGYVNPAFSWISVVLNLLFWVLIIVLVVKLVKHLSCQSGHGHCEHCGQGEMEYESDSIEIVRTRYAKGEITKKEFDQLKKDLSE